MKKRIVPTLLADSLEEYNTNAIKFGRFSEWLHIDIMDGSYVPTTSPDIFDILDQVKNLEINFAVHFMIDNPSINMCERISEYKNVKLVYFHSEVLQENKIEEFNDFSFDLALALKPDIDLSKEINKLLKVSDILIMTVHPGYNGAPFVPEALNKIDELKNKGFEGTFHIDGSVNKNTIEEILKFDPTVLNVGSAISGSENPEKAYLELTSFLN